MEIKIEYKNFVKLAHLFDYIIDDTIRTLIKYSLKRILDEFKIFNSKDIPKIKGNVLN